MTQIIKSMDDVILHKLGHKTHRIELIEKPLKLPLKSKTENQSEINQ